MNVPVYAPDQERDACGTGFVADIAGTASFRVLDLALTCVTDLTHADAPVAEAGANGGPIIIGSEETWPLPGS